MPSRTSIGWCDLTSNPLYAVRKSDGKRGWWCSKVSPGCAHCYAEVLNKRWGNEVPYLPANVDDIEWRLDERELGALVRRRKPARIFLGSMTDVFHPTIPGELLREVFLQIAIAHHHTFQVLTKRPREAKEFLDTLGGVFASDMWPLPNLWLGVSVENQWWAEERIPVLLTLPAAVRFVSCEPLLGPLDLNRWLMPRRYRAIDWGIIGGESGPACRVMDIDWARDLLGSFGAASVPVFFKQSSDRFPGRGRELDGETFEQFPEGATR